MARRAPVAPKGWPSARDPPWGTRRGRESGMERRGEWGWEGGKGRAGEGDKRKERREAKRKRKGVRDRGLMAVREWMDGWMERK